MELLKSEFTMDKETRKIEIEGGSVELSFPKDTDEAVWQNAITAYIPKTKTPEPNWLGWTGDVWRTPEFLVLQQINNPLLINQLGVLSAIAISLPTDPSLISSLANVLGIILAIGQVPLTTRQAWRRIGEKHNIPESVLIVLAEPEK